MANRKATFAKRQRETDLKDRAKAKDERRSQKRTEVRDSKGPQIAWDEAVYATTTSDELPALDNANQARPEQDDDGADDAEAAPAPAGAAASAAPPPSAAPASAAPASAAPASPAPRTTSGPIASKPSSAAPRRVS